MAQGIIKSTSSGGFNIDLSNFVKAENAYKSNNTINTSVDVNSKVSMIIVSAYAGNTLTQREVTIKATINGSEVVLNETNGQIYWFPFFTDNTRYSCVWINDGAFADEVFTNASISNNRELYVARGQIVVFKR